MAAKAGRPRIIAEYVAARLGHRLFAGLPFSWSMRLGAFVGSAWGRLDRRRREQVRTQAVRRLGLDDEAATRFVKENFRHYGLLLAEFCRLGRMRREDVAESVDFDGFDGLCRDLVAEGRGLVFVTAHFGNWEWGNSIASSLGVDGGVIARPLDNPLVNEFVRGIRERNGFRVLDKRGAIRGGLKRLRSGAALIVLVDQDAGAAGLMSPFLGETASTVTIPMELAVRVGAPLVVAAAVRRNGDPGRFRIRYRREPFRPRPEADPAEETRRLVDAVNEALGGLIMEAPEQWFWVHRRWKTRDGRVV